MKTKAEALAIVLDAGRRDRATESAPLCAAYGRVLAADAAAESDLPPFDKSSMDGWAVRAADVAAAPATLDVLGAVHAGEVAASALRPGCAWKIMTGAPLPAGADAVVMVEESEPVDGGRRVALKKPAKAGQNVCRRGEDARRGEVVVPRGTTLGATALAALASVGVDPAPVYAAPSVCVVPTGDELVPSDGPPPGPGQIRESNGILLDALVRAAAPCVRTLRPGVARDERGNLARFLDVGLAHDVLILSGGVSMGDLDLVGVALKERGLEVLIEKVSIKPGKPLLFGYVARKDGGRCAVFGLPGNPVSSFATFELFVGPYLAARLGRDDAAPEEILATLEHDRPLKAIPRTQHLPAVLRAEAGRLFVRPLPWNGSADLRGCVDANAFVVVPVEGAAPAPGDLVGVHRFAAKPLRGPLVRSARA